MKSEVNGRNKESPDNIVNRIIYTINLIEFSLAYNKYNFFFTCVIVCTNYSHDLYIIIKNKK